MVEKILIIIVRVAAVLVKSEGRQVDIRKSEFASGISRFLIIVERFSIYRHLVIRSFIHSLHLPREGAETNSETCG